MPVAIYSIPRAQRSGPPKTIGSGPGAYDPIKAPKHAMVNTKIGSEPRGKVAVQDVPGPGNYYAPVKNKHTAPQYSMGSRYRQRQGDDNPAPGNYDPNMYNQKSAPSFTMRPKTAVAKRNADNRNYDPNYNQSKEQHMRTKFGTDKKIRYANDTNPGPGAYERVPLNNFKSKKASAKFGTNQKLRVDRTTNLEAPGPGNYDMSS